MGNSNKSLSDLSLNDLNSALENAKNESFDASMRGDTERNYVSSRYAESIRDEIAKKESK